jgi:hypothetical protein
MKTIDPNERSTEVLPAGSEMTVTIDSGVASVIRSFGGAVVESGRISETKIYGPYAQDMAFAIACVSGVVTVDSAKASASLLPFSNGALVDREGGVYALSEATPYVPLTATGTAFTGACELAGWDVVAVTGTPTITIYDNTSAAGTVIVPATTLTVGRVEFAYKRALTTGCHVVLSGTQTVNVLVG